VIEFSYAYNLACAYNPEWSCSLPPAENWLKVAISRGREELSQGD
jgi:uncharacterized protein (DUF1684 family)